LISSGRRTSRCQQWMAAEKFGLSDMALKRRDRDAVGVEEHPFCRGASVASLRRPPRTTTLRTVQSQVRMIWMVHEQTEFVLL
jgi:hypothetical protein